jgi:hypothetical protein
MSKEHCVICGSVLGGTPKASTKLGQTILNETLKQDPDFKDMGNNPMPITPEWTKCCFDCNYKYVVPIRMGQIPDNIEADTFVSRPLIITLWTATGLYNNGNLYTDKFYLPETAYDTELSRKHKREKRKAKNELALNMFAEGGKI